MSRRYRKKVSPISLEEVEQRAINEFIKNCDVKEFIQCMFNNINSYYSGDGRVAYYKYTNIAERRDCDYLRTQHPDLVIAILMCNVTETRNSGYGSDQGAICSQYQRYMYIALPKELSADVMGDAMDIWPSDINSVIKESAIEDETEWEVTHIKIDRVR